MNRIIPRVLGFIFALSVCVLGSGVSIAQITGTSNTATNQYIAEFPDGGDAYKIATLPPNNDADADHIHLLATIDLGWGSNAQTAIDAIFGNRGGLTFLYSVRGAPLNPFTKLAAYQNPDSSVDIYIVFASVYGTASYTVLENQEETVYPSPVEIGAGTTPAGTLVFDTSSSSYPPVNSQDFSGNLSVLGNIGIGITPGNSLSTVSGINIDAGGLDAGNMFSSSHLTSYGLVFGQVGSGEGIGSARVPGSPNVTGLDFYTNFGKRMSISNSGNVGIGTAQPGATLDVNGNVRVASLGANNPNPICTDLNGVLTNSGCTGSGSVGVISQSNGNVGVGTTTPQSALQVSSPQLPIIANGGAWGNGNLTIQGTGTTRTPTMGAALSFAIPANTDGSNPWEQGRIMSVADNTNSGDASGRLLLQTRSPGIGWLWQTNLMLTSNGNVGIGMNMSTSQTPSAALEVNGPIKLTAGSGASMTYPDGTLQSTAWNGTTLGGDYAESIDVLGDRTTYEPGDIIAIDVSESGKFIKSETPYSRLVAGVYSTKPGLVGRRATFATVNKDDEVPMAMMGIVPTKVCDENGPIQRGDLLVSSSRPGYAMKATDATRTTGAVIGKALAPLTSGTGLIEVLITLQ